MITLHQRFVEELPVGAISQHPLVEKHLICLKIIQRIIELPRINFAVLLHVDDTAPFKGGDFF